MNLLVTGGAGFIGSNFVRHMLRKYPNYRVINVDALTYAGNLDNLRDVSKNPNYIFEESDITDRQHIDEIFNSGVDAVVHFAAETHVDRSIVDPTVFTKTNILGTQVLLECSRKYGVEKFVHVSTDEVYGTLGDMGYFNETSPLAPNSPYSASKASSDMIARAYYETFRLPVSITRCSNNYGPYQHPEKLIPLMIINALENKQLPVYGDGLNVRDWLHVEDHCIAIDLVLHNGADGAVYNIGGNNERKNIEIVEHILRVLGKDRGKIEFVQDRLGHDRRYAIDSTKIRRELGWLPQHTFESGIRNTINWYIHNVCWWEHVRSMKNCENLRVW